MSKIGAQVVYTTTTPNERYPIVDDRQVTYVICHQCGYERPVPWPNGHVGCGLPCV
jgi:hypothetical protein